MPHWTAADIPDQHGRVALVTGANSGIGYETARALARRGARVVLACRDTAKAERAAHAIGVSTVETLRLDLADPASIRAAAGELAGRHPRLDLLVNNAGVTGLKGRTAQGHEIQLAVNHLGHFALTGLLLPLLLATEASRVVTVASIAHRFGDTTDLTGDRGAYARAKLANLQFTGALSRRLTAADATTTALAAHPGGAATAVFRHGNPLVRAVNLCVARAFGRTPEMGALPTLRAATDPAARGGEYYGPTGLFEIAGYPGIVTASRKANDRAAQESLWARSAELTGVAHVFTAAGSAGR
ncbi:oxidoreductase [Phytomonospora endophytica]|uniref:NAD(P)-dependent dehydrogenase (Short-subunit alcohol dehydrogenase family) n=1 Tax=Phytomonospora endophytica TaxID=714109 RepID=A0A841G591_9ACTN|nr:oxidoreductase [Phytomonospora endophytica]MBB6039929.1 NAD(P)-dependent dehydrogenase (short-subunit alcohol dehydrogenase family) [Phytomonospora endophytica]GIG71001.1 putative short-chain dehydrogenase/reductase [Phytomonospora endophytica]